MKRTRSVSPTTHSTQIAERSSTLWISRKRSEIALVKHARRGGSALTVRILPCSRTIRETYKKYCRSQRSLTGLLPRYKGGGRAFPDPEAVELLAECVQEYAQPDRPTKINVVQETVRRFAEENERRSAEGRRLLSCPLRRTIARSIDHLDPFHVAVMREGPDEARRKFSSYGPGLTSGFPMDRIEIDEYMVDVQTVLTSLGVAKSLPEHIRRSIPKGRRWICVAMDAATRVVLGLVVAETPSSAVAVKLLRMIVADKTAIARAIGAESGWDFHRGLGVVATDAGTAFQSDAFQAAVHALHGRLEYGPVRVPEMRGTVERFFGSLSRSLMPRLSGRTLFQPRGEGRLRYGRAHGAR